MTEPRRGLIDLLEHELICGVVLGACVAGDVWAKRSAKTGRFGEVAHAHLGGKHKGWICIRKLRHYNATTIRHEIAHLVCGTTRHDETWRREVRALGGIVEKPYRKVRTA